jgi:hypothetical protein
MDLRNIYSESVDWIHLAVNRELVAFVSTVMSLRVTQRQGNL